MTTGFVLWLECHYNKNWSDVYVGTAMIDIVGMVVSYMVVKLLVS